MLCSFLMPSLLLAQSKVEIGNLVVENVPEINAAITERLEQYLNVRSASFCDWDVNDNGIYISTQFGETNQIHHVQNANADRRQITFFKEPITAVAVCRQPSMNGFIYSRDLGGNENFQIYFFDTKTGNSKLLTDGKSRNSFQGWNKQYTAFVYASNKRNGTDMDLYWVDFTNPLKEKLIMQVNGGGWSVAAISVDNQQLIIGNYKSINDVELFLYDVNTGTQKKINAAAKDKIYYSAVKFSKDGKGCFIISDQDNEFSSLSFYNITNDSIKTITKGFNGDVSAFDLNEDKSKLVFSVSENGISKLFEMTLSDYTFQPLKNIPVGVISSFKFHPTQNKIAFSLSTSSATGDVYLYDLKDSKLSRWTQSETGGLNPTTFVEASFISFPTFDTVDGKSRVIPAIVYEPKNNSGQVPVVILIHGGPEGQSLPQFNAFAQYLVNELNVAVILPNVRGSTGYGKTYSKLDNAFLRENSVLDIGSLLDWISIQPRFDSKRLAVYGGSYGGYMSLACMTHFNDRLKCGIDLFGISNFNTFLKNTSPYRADLRRVEYGDERDAKMSAHFDKISPIKSINKITKPMLIYQGKNDPRVPLSESDQMVEALKKQGNTVWYVMAKDEGHSLNKKQNRVYTQAAISLFLQTYLLK